MTVGTPTPSPWRRSLARRYRELALIARDPVLLVGLLLTAVFIVVLIFYPIGKVVIRAFFDKEGAFNIEYFARYVDPYFRVRAWRAFFNTLRLGLMTATGGTTLGFIFAYTMVRCDPPGKRWVHILALVPTVSPPFAIAISAILLFGRNGIVTHKLLGIDFTGINDLYGMDGLVFVQVMTFFSVAYLIIRAMLERLHPSMEEAAHSLGASKFHIFRTVTLPLLIPGLAASFLLLFVESMADLGNPLLLSGNVDVLAAQIFLAITGEFDFQKASTLAVMLLIPTLMVFLVQRYYVGKRSYVSVTGKPASGHIMVKEPITRWSFILITYAVLALIVIMYSSIIIGSFSTVWGIDFTPTLAHWQLMLGRGIEAIMDTTFLSILATPIAGLLGMGIAFLIVRKKFTGKEVVDFGSNLGAGIPGTILGIGFILAFGTPPWIVIIGLYLAFALFMVRTIFPDGRTQLLVLFLGTAIATALRFLEKIVSEAGLMYILGAGFMLIGGYMLMQKRESRTIKLLFGMGFLLMMSDLIEYVARPLAKFALRIENNFWGNVMAQFPDYLRVFFQVPQIVMMMIYLFILTMLLQRSKKGEQLGLSIIFLGLGGTLAFIGKPFVMTGTPYIIIAAFAVRSLPASVRAGVAALQQIDPAIEEASNSLGADAQYTFRKVTLPLISPALLAGLIFSFTRHMTSLSAIIFLISSRWRIVTASILGEYEQGGVSFAAAYATVIIVLVLIAIGILQYVTTRILSSSGDSDLTLGT